MDISQGISTEIKTHQLQIKEPPIILQIYATLQASIMNQCVLTFQYLNSFTNVYDLLSEYTARVNIYKSSKLSLLLAQWNAYVATMLQFEESLTAFSDIMNEAYETCFPGYPSFPKFSFWRLMVCYQRIFKDGKITMLIGENLAKRSL